MNKSSIKDLKEILELAKSNNVSVDELIRLIQNTNPELLQLKEKFGLRRWGIILAGLLAIISLSGAIFLASTGSSAAIVFALIFASFASAGGAFALSSLQNVSTKDFSEMVSDMIKAIKKEDKIPLNIPLKTAKSQEYEPIPTEGLQEQDGHN